MKILRESDYRPMPWKNGGGVTTEIVVSPAGASLEDFDWRISMALVKGDGPFSVFPGIDRTLSILSGAGFDLTVGETKHHLTQGSAPLPFPADVPTAATLIGGDVTDLNVMSRRNRWRHEVKRLTLTEASVFTHDAAALVLFCESGPVTVTAAGHAHHLGDRDAAMVDQPGPVKLEAAAAARIQIISLHRI